MSKAGTHNTPPPTRKTEPARGRVVVAAAEAEPTRPGLVLITLDPDGFPGLQYRIERSNRTGQRSLRARHGSHWGPVARDSDSLFAAAHRIVTMELADQIFSQGPIVLDELCGSDLTGDQVRTLWLDFLASFGKGNAQ